MPRRQVDDETPDFAFTHRRELCGDDLDVPAHRKARPRVQLAEAALRKADKIPPRQRAVLVEAQRFGRSFHHRGTEDAEDSQRQLRMNHHAVPLSSHRRRPMPTVNVDPGLRRDNKKDINF